MSFSHVLTKPLCSTLPLYFHHSFTSPPTPLSLLPPPSRNILLSSSSFILLFVSLFFFLETWLREKRDKAGGGKEMREGRTQSLGFECTPASLSPGLCCAVWVFLVLNLSVGVFAFVCCRLPLRFYVTFGRPAGLKQQPAEASRHFEPNIETCRATRQSHPICPLLPNKVRAIMYKKKSHK